jgi:hypothetical protein
MITRSLHFGLHLNSLWNKFANESNFNCHNPTPHTTYILLNVAIKAKCLEFHCSTPKRNETSERIDRFNHWANATNLIYKVLKQCCYYSWNAKSKIAFQKLVVWAHLQLTLLALSKVRKVWLQTRMEVVCTVLIYHSVKKSFEHMFWCSNTSSDSAVGAYSP